MPDNLIHGWINEVRDFRAVWRYKLPVDVDFVDDFHVVYFLTKFGRMNQGYFVETLILLC